MGSASFAKEINPDDVVAMINIEMIGKPSKFGTGKLWITGAEQSNLKALMNLNLAPEQHIQTNPYKTMNLFYRSDNATLARLGVPAHSLSSTQIDIDKNYHAPTDEIGTLDLDSLYQVVSSIGKASEGLTKGEVTPTRVKPLPARRRGKIF